MYALSRKLLIIGLLLEYFATNVPYFFTDCTFSYGKVKNIYYFGIRIKFHLGRAKGKGKRRIWRRSPK